LSGGQHVAISCSEQFHGVPPLHLHEQPGALPSTDVDFVERISAFGLVNMRTNNYMESMKHTDRYFIIKSADENQPIAKLSPFIIDKALQCTIGTAKTVQALRSGDLLVQVSRVVQSIN